MRTFLLPLLCLCLHLSSHAQDSTRTGKATIYIYRGGQLNAALSNWAIFVDGKKICKLSNNKFIIVTVEPGKRKITSKVGGVDLFKKEMGIEIEAEAGGTYYVATTVKSSITRSRLEFMEVTKSTGTKQMEGMVVDNCQEKIDAGEN